MQEFASNRVVKTIVWLAFLAFSAHSLNVAHFHHGHFDACGHCFHFVHETHSPVDFSKFPCLSDECEDSDCVHKCALAYSSSDQLDVYYFTCDVDSQYFVVNEQHYSSSPIQTYVHDDAPPIFIEFQALLI